MTMKEASVRYGIPVKILKEYESWGLCGAVKKVMGKWQIDAEDLERLSLIMTLYDSGFDSSEVEAYIRLVLEKENAQPQQLAMLRKKREKILDEIHFKEKQISYLDYLRYEIKKEKLP